MLKNIAKGFIISALALSLPLTIAEAKSIEAQTRAYIQSGLTTNSGREISTGIEMSGEKPVTVLGDAETFNYSVLESIDSDDAIDPSALVDFQQFNESFRLPNAAEWNQQYKLITTGGDGTKTYKSTNILANATHPQKIGLAALLAVGTELSLGIAKFIAE